MYETSLDENRHVVIKLNTIVRDSGWLYSDFHDII